MPNDDTHKPPPEADDIAPKSTPLRWLWKFNHGFDLVKGLSLVTVLSSLAVGYFQYLNAYQEKVGSQARKTWPRRRQRSRKSHAHSPKCRRCSKRCIPISRAPSGTDPMPATQALGTKNAHAISERYEKARIALRENIDVLTRKAEVYIDWASDMYRDAADKRNVDDDPLSQQVLRDYAFDCSDKYNFPAFGNVHASDDDMRPSRKFPTTNIAPLLKNAALTTMTRPKDAFIRICAGPNDKDAKESIGTAPSTTS